MLSKSFSRRSFFQGLTAISALALPTQLLAQIAGAGATGIKVKIVVSEIANNHGHVFTMNLADLVRSGEMNYSIQGHAGHPHFIRITNDMLTKLTQLQSVNISTSTDMGHSHQVTMKVMEN